MMEIIDCSMLDKIIYTYTKPYHTYGIDLLDFLPITFRVKLEDNKYIAFICILKYFKDRIEIVIEETNFNDLNGEEKKEFDIDMYFILDTLFNSKKFYENIHFKFMNNIKYSLLSTFNIKELDYLNFNTSIMDFYNKNKVKHLLNSLNVKDKAIFENICLYFHLDELSKNKYNLIRRIFK